MRRCASQAKAATLIKTYGKCGSVERAKAVFDAIPDADIVCWTALIVAYSHNGDAKRAIDLVRTLLSSAHLHPDAFTYTAALDACSSAKDLALGTAIHAQIRSSALQSNAVVKNALINMYSQCGQLDRAREIFDSMAERNVISWNTIIGANAQNRKFDAALELFREMDLPPSAGTFVAAIAACWDLAEARAIHARVRALGLENAAVCSALIDSYARCGGVDEARRLFERIKLKLRSAHVWASTIAAYSRVGQPQESLAIFREMERSRVVRPDAVTFVAALGACASARSLERGREIHARVTELRLLDENAFLGNALVNLYAKCGSIEEARGVFEGMEIKDVVSWNSIISSCTQLGRGGDAIALFRRMESETAVEANGITYQSVVAACASSGDVDLGREIHARVHRLGFLASDSKLATSIVEMYCCCSRAIEAREILAWERLRDPGAWTTTLAAIAHHGSIEEALALELEMELSGVEVDAVTYVSLLAACSHGGLVDRGCGFFAGMVGDRGIAPLPEHYACVVDVIARAGWIVEALDVIRELPFEADLETYMAVLGACRTHNEVELGCRVARLVLGLDPSHFGAYSLLYNMLSSIHS